MKAVHSKRGLVFSGLLLMVTSATFSACGPAPAKGQTYKFAWIPKNLNPLYEVGKEGALAKARELTQKGPDTVEVAYFVQDDAPAGNQALTIEGALDAGVQAIVAVPQSATILNDSINRAADAGINTILYDGPDAPDSKRLTFFSLDNVATGKVAAKLMSTALGAAGGKVAILRNELTSANVTERVTGFQSEIAAKYPTITVAATVSCSGTDINVANDHKGCSDKMEAVMTANPDLKGWLFVAVWRRIELPNTAKTAVAPTWRSGTYKTIAFDSLKDTMPTIRSGKVYAIIGQKYWDWGYQTIQMAYDHVKSAKSFPTFVDTGFDVVCPNNVELMDAAWTTYDFSVPLPACDKL